MALYIFSDYEPVIEDKSSIFIAQSADIIGKVRLAQNSSVWFGAVLRGDLEEISIGEGSNIQDLVVIHTDEYAKAIVGKNCTIGHRALLHSCFIDDHCLIGMGAILMNHAEIGSDSIVGAGALITEGKIFPPQSLIVGAPAKVKRMLTENEILEIRLSAERYQKKAKEYLTQSIIY